jgi:RHS repeat-associated protein
VPPDLAGYYIYRKTSGSYGSPLNGVPITSTNFTDLAVTNGTTYYYHVKAVDTAGGLSLPSNEVSAKPSKLQMGHRHEGDEDPAADLVLAEGADGWDDPGLAPYRVIGQSGSVTIFFLHSDHLGSLRLVTDTGGAVVSNHKYLPFGEEVQPMRSTNPFRFAGYERDSESGKDYVKARYYSPSMARWLSPDPLGGGYPYVANNPANFYDPMGLKKCPPPQQAKEPCVDDEHITVIGEEYGVSLEPTGHEYDDLLRLYCPTCLMPVPQPGVGGGAATVSPAPDPPKRQTFSECMAANSSAFSMAGLLEDGINFSLGAMGIAGVDFKDSGLAQMFLGNTISGTLFGPGSTAATNVGMATPGILRNGMGNPITYGRRTTTILGLNIAGTPGGPPRALGSAAPGLARGLGAASKVLGLGMNFTWRLAIDGLLTGIEAAVCGLLTR